MRRSCLLATLTILVLSMPARPEANLIQDEPLPGLRLVKISAGKFKMGSTYADNVACHDGEPPASKNIPQSEWSAYCHEHGPAAWFEDESPRHVVRVEEFWMSDAEVTVAQFREFVNDTRFLTYAERTGNTLGIPSLAELETFETCSDTWAHPWPNADAEDIDRHPVVHVSWEDCQAFCEWLSSRTGAVYRLPTEAEWEYAALGGRTSTPETGTFAWGNCAPENTAVANIADNRFKHKFPSWKYPVLSDHNDGFALTAPVRSYPPNCFGLYDMSGNVWEWTCETYLGGAYANRAQSPTTHSPRVQLEGAGFFHTMRGGSFDFELPFVRVQKRRTLAAVRKQHPVRSSISVGFRIVRDLNEASHALQQPE